MATVPKEAFTMELQQLDDGASERAKWLLGSPAPPAPWRQVYASMKKKILPGKNSGQKPRTCSRPLAFLQGLFPILEWGRNYKATKFKNDLMAGLTLASLCIPQVFASSRLVSY